MLMRGTRCRQWDRTAGLCLSVAVLVASPLFHSRSSSTQQSVYSEFADLIFGRKKQPHQRSMSEERSMDRVHGLTVLAAAWAAASLSKLDWRQEWQEYPVPSVAGALVASLVCDAGCLAHSLLSRLLRSANY